MKCVITLLLTKRDLLCRHPLSFEDPKAKKVLQPICCVIKNLSGL